jgi:hypothetical protein
MSSLNPSRLGNYQDDSWRVLMIRDLLLQQDMLRCRTILVANGAKRTSSIKKIMCDKKVLFRINNLLKRA